MKKIFFVIAIGAFSFASAQNNQTPAVSRPKMNSLETPRFYIINPPQTRLMVNGQLINRLPNGNKVYALAQDNMPCIVPDMSQYNMSVVKPAIVYNNIQNPALQNPPSNKPMILTEEQLKKLWEMYKQQHQ